ncbi:MAG TPA: hypothetical protein VKV17_00940 [Bryobacteraceae bacterium]|nr:hypothetical protein [Bryobacteraceae bacterium]
MRWRRAARACCWLADFRREPLARSPAGDARVIEHTAPFDPLCEDWKIHNDLVGMIVEDPSRAGFDAWRVTSPR